MALPKRKPTRMKSQLFRKQKVANEPPIIELKNIHKAYTESTVPVKALNGVNLQVRRGEMLAIMGPSGSGKSTLLNIIGLLDTPDTGKLLLAGVDVAEFKRRRLPVFRQQEVGIVFQQKNLIPTLTAWENVYLPLRYTRRKRQLKREQATEALRLVGLGDRADHRPSQLSGGEQQRVAIARALVLSPALVLADEPTGELDSKTGHQIIQLMHDLNATLGQTFIIVTHNEMIAEASDRVLHMQDGKLIDVTDKKRKR